MTKGKSDTSPLNARIITQHRPEDLLFNTEGGLPLPEGVRRKDLYHTTRHRERRKTHMQKLLHLEHNQ